MKVVCKSPFYEIRIQHKITNALKNTTKTRRTILRLGYEFGNQKLQLMRVVDIAKVH